jgi:Asp-tRNA(Asn)/Glu-tRNA(Gln) amidotransferase A subunit family amidase
VLANRVRTAAIANLQSLFELVDVIATPSTACVAPEIPNVSPISGKSDLPASGEVMRYAFLGNLTGCPAVSLPSGLAGNESNTTRGIKPMPVGFQFMSAWWNEEVLLYLAKCHERDIVKDNEHLPDIWYDLLEN